MLQFTGDRSRRRSPDRPRFENETRFLRSWFERPLLTGAVAPSGRFLADAMASYVHPRRNGQIVELGPGTGPVTEALLRRGIEQERLVLVEYSADFCALLKRRYPRATIIQGDAYAAGEVLADVVQEPCAAVLSSLPLLNKPLDQRIGLLHAAHDMLDRNAPFVQFTYGVKAPIPSAEHYTTTPSDRIWLNFPPARVWVYRRP
ncbi:class I SAM-dependent methyltransferase [Enterovirga rhinocerotis]|uniref:Phosphatidylethanolamine/phosphatidyl-N-methylethanolamine N-methyltransferase n=1 Tax=Enterovirga rhinocerotis TaxID=1339210 RepID=A0A4R7CB17_9HYPH|nr:rRNA adenine N-6-methyltransferase family protein [Enterovirga rhinocerotis]TDR94615.1 phosphatidylethanolamine/phosphatidyl-N-methylethanolamine N-methyltransferase [Enterovirga rhinocerotis]